MTEKSKSCIFIFPGFPSLKTLDFFATLHLCHGIDELLLPSNFLESLQSRISSKDNSIELKKDLPFVKKIPDKVIKVSLKNAQNMLNSIGLQESICSYYPDHFYLDILRFFQQWFIAKKMNAQICTHYAGLLLDTCNILAYEYAAILPVELSRELVAWIYANSASGKANAEFFELQYRNQDLVDFLHSKYTPNMSQMRLNLSRATSPNSKWRILRNIQGEIENTGKYLSEHWTDAIKIGAGSLIATFINPLSWISTILDGIKFSKNLILETRTRKNPIFSFEKTFDDWATLAPDSKTMQLNFSDFWKEARSGRLKTF